MNNDLISREALKDVLKECAYSYDGVNTWIMKDEVLGIIDNAPTVEPDMEFAKWVTKMIFGNNEFEDFDFELFSELACRKLEKLGLVQKAKSEWIKMK